MSFLQYSLPRYFLFFFLLLTLFVSANSYAQLPYITSATVQVTTPLENGAKVSYGGSDVWVTFGVEAAGNDSSQFWFQLWEQYNNGSWELMGTFQGERQVWDWFVRRPTPIKTGTYKYKISVNKSSYYTWSTPVETDSVTIRAPRKAPSATFTYFQVHDIYGYVFNKQLEETPKQYLFHKDNSGIIFTWSRIANDAPLVPDLYYEFMSRKVGGSVWKIDKVNSNMDTFPWVPFEQGLYGLNDLETYEFAIRACNPYGCTPSKLFPKPILIDYPDITTIPPRDQYTQITGADLWFEVYDDVKKITNLQNYCLADPITRKCKASAGRIVGRVDGVASPGALSLYKGTTLVQHATGTGSIYVGDAVKDLPVGTYSFVLKSGGGAEGVFLRKRFYVYIPNEGSIEASSCAINPADNSCTTSITWTVSGDYASCLFQINGSTRTELGCVSGGSNQAQNTVATISVTASRFEIVAKEPTAERVIAESNIGASFKEVSLSATPERCDIIRPATTCLTRVSWKASADYTPCLYQNNSKLICSNESQLEIAVSSPTGTQFKLINGSSATDKLLASTTVKAVKPPTGSLVVASGSQNPCIPNNTNTCTVNVTYSHIGGHMGVSLYKDGQEWAFLGTSGETPPNTFTKPLTVSAGGTTYSLRAKVDGQLYEIASLPLYTTTYTSQGYSLTATPNECTYNPVTQAGCKPTLTWSLPQADACIFKDNKIVFCPDSSFLNGSSSGTLDLSGSRIYQLRKGTSPAGALVAQVGVLGKEQTVADIKALLKGCNSAGCKLSLQMFNNYTGNVCLYDNGIKAEGYCNINRHNYVSDYLAAPGTHKLELKLVDSSGKTSLLADTTIELKYAPFAPSEITTAVSGNSISINWPVVLGSATYTLERNGEILEVNGKRVTDKLLLNAYSDTSVIAGKSYTYRVKACIFDTLCSGWTTAAPIVFAPSDKLSINLVSPAQNQTSIQLGENLSLIANVVGNINNILWVKFYANGELINAKSFNTGPYVLSWTPSEGGDYVVKAVVMNTSGVQTSSVPVNVSVLGSVRLNAEDVENLPTGIDSDGKFTLRWSSATAADYFVLMEGEREIYRGAELIKTFNVKAGTYKYSIKACQIQPATCSYDTVKTIKVNLGAADNVVDLKIPSPDRQQIGTLGQQFALYADVETSMGDIWRAADGSTPTVEFYANNVLLTGLATDSTGALKFWRPSQVGSYLITASAVVDGGKKITSRVATIQVNNNSAPLINLVSPLAHERVQEGKSIKLTAQVADNENNTAQVVFLANGTPIGQLMTAPPYEMQWTPPKPGIFNLSARAIDRGGLQQFAASQPLIVESLFNAKAPTEFLSPDYSPLGTQTKVLRAADELNDLLILAPPNAAGISFNAFTSFMVGQPLKILNVDKSAAGSPAAKLIVIDAQTLALNNTLEIVGAAADVLLINRTPNTQLKCLYCNFVNVGRVTLAAAQPVSPLNASSTQVGDLIASGNIIITKLNAPAAQVQLLGKTVTTVKNDAFVAINTQQKANLYSNGYVLDDNGDKQVGTGSVNIIAGETKVAYSNFNVLGFNANTNAPMTTIDGNIRSGAIKVVAASSLTINSQLSTQSDVQASFVDKGEFKLASERIELATLDNTNGHLIINGTVASDHKIKIVSTGNIQSNLTSSIMAGHIEAIAAKDIINFGVMSCADSVCGQSSQPLVTNLYLAAEGIIDNQNSIQGFTNITLTAASDLNNRFGGSVAGVNVYLNSKNGNIRNGWATPYENLPENYWVLKPSAYTQQLSTFDKFILPKIDGSQTPAKKARTKEAYIFGNNVIVKAKRHVENINASFDVYKYGTLTPKEDGASATTVSISALDRLEVNAGGYILNSSASMTVENNGVDRNGVVRAMILIAPQVHNERYFMYALGDLVNEQGVVIQTSDGTGTTTLTQSKNLEARLYVYSPAAVLYSAAPTLFTFDDVNNLASIFNGDSVATKKGFENNISYFIVDNDVQFKGEGALVRSKGILLERENYYLKKTQVIANERCRSNNPGQQTSASLPVCAEINTINANPLGETVAETIERTIFAVSGQLDGSPANFIAFNQNPLDQAKENFVDAYKKEAITRLSNDLSKGAYAEKKLISIAQLISPDGLWVTTTAKYQYLNPDLIRDPSQFPQTTETKSVWDIVVEGFAVLKTKFLELLAAFEKGI